MNKYLLPIMIIMFGVVILSWTALGGYIAFRPEPLPHWTRIGMLIADIFVRTTGVSAMVTGFVGLAFLGAFIKGMYFTKETKQ